jgi:glycosyltransferase involved in cell wall biosynthesis
LSLHPPRVSVILPTFNRAATLRPAIDSVLNQSYRALELIVVDDASTDETEALVSSIDDARISYLRHNDNSGGSAARNSGLQAATGELLAFQDSDDLWLSEKLERQIALLDSKPEVGLVWCPYSRKNRHGVEELQPAAPMLAPRGEVQAALLEKNFIGTPTIVARRLCYERCGGFDEALPRFQDWDWVVRVAAQFQFDHLTEPLVAAGWAENNITDGHSESLVQAERILLEKHREALTKIGVDLLAHRIWHYSHICLMAGEISAGRAALREARDLQPTVSRTLYSILAHCPPLYRLGYRLMRG